MSQLHMWHGYGNGSIVAVGIPAPKVFVEMVRDWWQLFAPSALLMIEDVA